MCQTAEYRCGHVDNLEGKCHEYVLMGLIRRAKCEYCTCNCDYLHHSIIVVIIILFIKASFLHVLYTAVYHRHTLFFITKLRAQQHVHIYTKAHHKLSCCSFTNANVIRICSQLPILQYSRCVSAIMKGKEERENPITAPRKTEINLLISFYSLQLIFSIVHRKQASSTTTHV